MFFQQGNQNVFNCLQKQQSQKKYVHRGNKNFVRSSLNVKHKSLRGQIFEKAPPKSDRWFQQGVNSPTGAKMKNNLTILSTLNSKPPNIFSETIQVITQFYYNFRMFN